MSDRIYEEAFKYAMDEIHQQYVKEGKESAFTFNFNVTYVGDENETITVSVGNAFMKNQVTSKGTLTVIENKLREITCLNNLKVECIIQSDNKSESKNETPVVSVSSEPSKIIEEKEENPEPVVEVKPKKSHPQLRNEFVFENFIPGDNCMFAYNAALSVAKNPGTSKNPIIVLQ